MSSSEGDNTGAGRATTRKRGSRGKGRRLRRQIDRAAEERQAAWDEAGQPNLTEKLTRDLNGREHVKRPEGLYAELRQHRAGDS